MVLIPLAISLINACLLPLVVELQAQFLTFQALQKPSSSPRLRVQRPWTPPSVGWIKANIDGAFNCSAKNGGMGVIFRDSEGEVVAGGCRYVSEVSSAEEVEMRASRWACQLAVTHQLTPIIFESDCLTLVQATKDQSGNLSLLGRLVDDIVDSLHSARGLLCPHL
ncbi:uncharacterized protein LOC133737379 [Rosa rugosa]|uniref:uncharacterized protein LOC133737379 n=1 Tax=Rosa rugosa TaxID=74645 RepID=UPI002B4147BB|nr:uncharacterized protein LOC133737379 [Rosa rugosa]